MINWSGVVETTTYKRGDFMELGSVIVVNNSRCTYCRKCAKACEEEHGISRISFKNDLPNLCVHCNIETAKCRTSCPEDAIYEEDGILRVDKKRCTLCRRCIFACPIEGVVEDKYTEAADKCTLCIESSGAVPKCIEVCTDGALELISVKRISEMARINEIRG